MKLLLLVLMVGCGGQAECVSTCLYVDRGCNQPELERSDCQARCSYDTGDLVECVDRLEATEGYNMCDIQHTCGV